MFDKDEFDEYMALMRKRSGEFSDDGKLAGFLYILMRDHLPCGIIEQIMLDHVGQQTNDYTNGWLAQYAKDVAARLTDTQGEKDK